MRKSILFIFCLLMCSALSFSETGYASWYGGKFQGRTTANGEIFDTNLLTAAHKTLPFNSMVKVVNLENGKEVIVRINDRGPFVKGRIIDLSRAAAVRIGMSGSGVARVCIEIISMEVKKICSIQAGAFSKQENALRLLNSLTAKGYTAGIEKTENGISRVIIREIRIDDLENVKKQLSGMGLHSVLVRYH